MRFNRACWRLPHHNSSLVVHVHNFCIVAIVYAREDVSGKPYYTYEMRTKVMHAALLRRHSLWCQSHRHRSLMSSLMVILQSPTDDTEAMYMHTHSYKFYCYY